jgi:hypothetical protein
MSRAKLGHAFFTSMVSILFAYLWAVARTVRVGQVMIFGAFLFLLITGIILFIVIEGSHYNAVTAYIEALVKMPSDLRNQLAFSVPSLRLVARRGQVQTLFDETRATKEHLHLFLQDSTSAQTASKRNWHTHERPAWAWDEIYNYLDSRGMVGKFSVGPDSYPWVGTAYQNLSVYFLESITNLNYEEAQA